MVVHTQVGGCLLAKQHDILVERVEVLLQTDPHQLLPEHRVLLEMDFEKVGSGSPLDLQLWAAEMDSALGVRCGEAYTPTIFPRFTVTVLLWSQSSYGCYS